MHIEQIFLIIRIIIANFNTVLRKHRSKKGMVIKKACLDMKDHIVSRFVWEYEQEKGSITVWSNVKKINRKARSNFCKLCLIKKYFILNALGDNKLLHKKFQFINKCCHQNKLLLRTLRIKIRKIKMWRKKIVMLRHIYCTFYIYLSVLSSRFIVVYLMLLYEGWFYPRYIWYYACNIIFY